MMMMRSGLLAGIRWSVCVSKILCISFSITDSGLCIYHLIEWSNFNFLHNSRWITFPTQGLEDLEVDRRVETIQTTALLRMARILYIYIYIYIMSCRQHGYPWHSRAIFPCRSSPLAGLQGYIPYPHIAAVCRFELVVLLLLGHMWVSQEVSLMSSSLLLQQCPACLVRLTWIVFVMGGRWPYSWCFVGCCFQDLFNIARSILV